MRALKVFCGWPMSDLFCHTMFLGPFEVLKQFSIWMAVVDMAYQAANLYAPIKSELGLLYF